MQLCPEGLAEEDSEEETSFLKDSNPQQMPYF